jgi:hypothetical protein
MQSGRNPCSAGLHADDDHIRQIKVSLNNLVSYALQRLIDISNTENLG